MIPKQLHNPKLGFVLLKKKEKVPFESAWQNKPYKYDDKKLLDHIKKGGNYGVIGGYGDLRILDVDDLNYTKEFTKLIGETLTIKTGGGGLHFYIYSDYHKNNVLINGIGELRANNYQCVGAGSTHPNGKKYTIINESKIKYIDKKDVEKILEPYLRSNITTTEIDSGKVEQKDITRSASEMTECIKFCAKGLSKKEVFEKMKVYAKWSDTPIQYKDKTYNKAVAFLNKKKEINPEYLDLLDKVFREPKYLDLGECSEGWYFGFKLGGFPAIITSQGNIYKNDKRKVKENGVEREEGENEIIKLIKYEGYLGSIAPLITNETIKAIYLNHSKNNIVNPKQMYKTIRDKILYYMDFVNDNEIADVLTCWIIATYCYPLFYWFPHLLFNAPSGSGKSKCAAVVSYLSFRGFDLGASAGVTPAQIFRTLEGNRGMVLIDEFEQQEGKQKSETQNLVNQILNASCAKDAYVIRTEKIDGKWTAWKFPIFSPKTCCNISGINSTSLSRFIYFKWLKSISIKSKRKPYRQKDKLSFEPIKNELYILLLENWKKIKDNYDNLEVELSAREEDNWLPLLAVAKFIDDCDGEYVDATKQIRMYLDKSRDFSIQTNDPTEDFLRLLYDNVTEESQKYRPSEIGKWSEVIDLFSWLKNPSSKVGGILTSFKFKEVRSGAKYYILSKELVKKRLDLYYPELPSLTLPTLPNTTNPTLHYQKGVGEGRGGRVRRSGNMEIEEIKINPKNDNVEEINKK